MKKTQKKKGRNIFITGAAGFIGSNVLEHLFEKYEDYNYTVLDSLTYAGNLKNFPPQVSSSPRFKFVYGDITNAEVVDSIVSKSDVVIHFAAETHVTRSIHDNVKFFVTDVLGTQAIANSVYRHKKNIDCFIHISTCEVYGQALTKKMDEHHAINPHSPYAAAKVGADRLVYSYYVTYDIPAVILRPFNIYGPRQHLEKAVPRFITSAIFNEPLTVHGTGQPKRDYMYVSDLARAIDLLIHAPIEKIKGEVFNVGSGKAISIIEIANLVSKYMKVPKNKIHFVKDRPGQVSIFAADYSKFNKLFGWSPTINFKDGLKRTIEWYKNNEDVWKQQAWLRSVPIVMPDGSIEYH